MENREIERLKADAAAAAGMPEPPEPAVKFPFLKRQLSVGRLVVAALLVVVAILTAWQLRRTLAHPRPDLVLDMVTEAAAPGTEVELPRQGRLVVAVKLDRPEGDNFMAKVYRLGQSVPVWKDEGLDPKDGKLSLILPLAAVPAADYMVRVQAKNGDDEDGAYRFTTVAPR